MYVRFLSLNDGGRDRGGDPEDLLLRLHLGGQRHGVRAGIDAVDDLDLFLVDQPLDLVDRRIGLALGVGVDRLDLVFAGHAAALVDEIDGDLRADRGSNRAAGRERPGQIIDDADAHRLRLCAGVAPVEADAAAAAAEFFSSDRREIFIAFLPDT